MVERIIHQEVAMRGLRSAVAVGIGVVLPVLFACASPPKAEQPPVVTAFAEGTGTGAQARQPEAPARRTDLEECRTRRQQAISPRERGFPCEAFIGE